MLKYLLQEIDLMAKCNCDNLLKLLSVVQIPYPASQIYLVTEKCDSNMRKYFKTKKVLRADVSGSEPFMPECEIQYWMKQIVNGLYYLHVHKKIIHRDIKPDNLLLINKNKSLTEVFDQHQGHYTDYTLVIGDFGLSKNLKEDHPITFTNLGKYNYVNNVH